MVAREMLRFAWLGVVSSLLALVPLLGTLAAPALSEKLGARRGLKPANRALLLATVTALMGGADVLGTFSLGAIIGVMGSGAALLVVLAWESLVTTGH